MRSDTQSRQWRETVVTIVLALLFGGGIFCFALLIAGEVLIPVLVAVAAMILVGLLHYVLWGRAMSADQSRRRYHAEPEDNPFRRDSAHDSSPAQNWRDRYRRPVE